MHYFYTARAFANCDGTIMANVLGVQRRSDESEIVYDLLRDYLKLKLRVTRLGLFSEFSKNKIMKKY